MSDNQEQTQSNKKLNPEFGLSSLSVDNRTTVLILGFLITVLGVLSYTSMPKESFPEIVIPTIYVGTIYPGNSPVDMENLITRPIEKELKSLNGVESIKSTSIQDYSTIIVEFNTEEDVDRSLQDVKDAVDKAKSELPTDLDQDPNVFEINFSEFPIMYVNVAGDYALDELKQYAEYLEDEIESLTEISKATVRGALDREIRIDADPFKMQSMEVSFGDISQAVSGENVTISGGNILMGDFRRSVRVQGEFTDPAQIRNIIVKKNRDGTIVYLRDVAEVHDTYEERSSYARSFGLPVVTVEIIKRSGENLLDAADKITDIIQTAKRNRFPENLEVYITNDQSRQTRNMVSNLENSIISGVILVVLVLMFFMGLRNALFVGIAIPLSMFLSFMILSFLDVTMNIMVLFSLILALGMLVDNGIVVVENIYRLLQEGKTPIRAAKEGVGEVALPIITSTLTTLAAFLPLAFWGDIIGEFMRYLPITLIIVLSSSLFVALVINPVLTSMFMKLQKSRISRPRRLLAVAGVLAVLALVFYLQRNYLPANLLLLAALFIPFNLFLLLPAVDWFQKSFLGFLEYIYERTLRFALQGLSGFAPYLFLLGMVGLLVGSVMLVGYKQPKVEFFPVNQPNYINVFIEMPIGTDITTTNRVTKEVEQVVMEMLEPYEQDSIVESVISQVGEGAADPNAEPGGGNQATPNKSRITVFFVESEYRGDINTRNIMIDLQKRLTESPGADQFPGVDISVDKDRQGPPVGKPINLEVVGEDLPKLVELAQRIRREIEEKNYPGVEELKLDMDLGKPELLYHIDRERAGRFGLSTGQIANELRIALFGQEVSQYKEGEDDYPIQLRLKDRYRYDVENLLNKTITFRNNTGQLLQVPISAVANVEYTSTYGSVKRIDLDRVISIYSNVKEGYNANEIISEIRGQLANMDLPEGFSVRITGEQEEQAESTEFLLQAMFIAVFVIFMIIVAQFNSIFTPFIILASVIFSTIGVLLGLIAFGMNFVIIMTGIGIISLAGVVVNNAIVLIDYTNLTRNRRKQELDIDEREYLPNQEYVECVIQAGKTRLRPVLLTAITTVLGLIPLAIGLNIDFYSLLAHFDPRLYWGGDNAIFWGPMAWTVIFGLVFATFLTLVIVPVMYTIAERLRKALHYWKKAQESN